MNRISKNQNTLKIVNKGNIRRNVISGAFLSHFF